MKTIGNFMVKTLAVAVILFNIRAEAGVALGATRIVYPAEQKQVTLGVSNNNDKDTFLIQSWVENEDGEKESLFVITPPLFLMQGKKKIRCALSMPRISLYPRTKRVFSGLMLKPFPLWIKKKERKHASTGDYKPDQVVLSPPKTEYTSRPSSG